MIAYEDISHLAMEVTDLDAAERFYAGALGMELICRDSGELGNGRLILKNGSGQLLFLEKVDEMSQRSRFSGPTPTTFRIPAATSATKAPTSP